MGTILQSIFRTSFFSSISSLGGPASLMYARAASISESLPLVGIDMVDSSLPESPPKFHLPNNISVRDGSISRKIYNDGGWPLAAIWPERYHRAAGNS